MVQDGTHGGVRDAAAAFPGFLYMQVGVGMGMGMGFGNRRYRVGEF